MSKARFKAFKHRHRHFQPRGNWQVCTRCGRCRAWKHPQNVLPLQQSGYSDINVRNNSLGNITFGNNVEISGTGLVLMNPLGTAPVNAVTTMGNLKIGGGQELGVFFEHWQCARN